MMHILLINHYAGSPKYGMEYRPYYLAKEWIEMGHQVTILAASFSHLRQSQPHCGGTASFETIDGINYVWLPTPSYAGNGMKRIINMLTFIKQLRFYIGSLTGKERIDAVIASSTYPLDIYPANLLKKRQGAKLIFEVHDLWPLSPMELGDIPAWHPYIMLMQHAENFAYKKCDAVVSLLPCAMDHMVEHGLKPDKYQYLPNGINVFEWVEPSLPLSNLHRKLLNDLKEQGLFIVGYAGAHGVANALDSFVVAASLCKDDNIAFVLVGQGPERDNLQKLASDMGVNNLFFLPPVPKNSVPSLLDRFDACYIGLMSQPLFRFGVSPNKLMDYMMAAKPVIFAIESGNDPVTESGAGISIPPENPEAIANAARKLKALEENERALMGQRGKDYVLENHDYRVIARKFSYLAEDKNLA